MGTVNFDKITDKLQEKGVEAYTEQTGGGTATIMVGKTTEEPGWGPRYELLVGPGWFETPVWKDPRGDTTDLAIGPDDDGVTDPVFTTETWTEDDVVNEVLRQLKKEA